MQRLYPLTAPFVSRLTRSDHVVSHDVLQPEETEQVVPPYISDASRERASASHPWSSVPAELALLDEKEVKHAPVVRTSYGPGIVGPDGFATARQRLRLGSKFTLNALTKAVSQASSVTYINDRATNLYFGHWLKDGVPQTYYAEDGTYYLSNPATWLHCAQYRDVLQLRPRDDHYVVADEVITYSDFSQGSLKRDRYRKMKQRLAAMLPTAQTSNEKVFLWRGDEGVSRNFRDADRVRDKLETLGWKIVDVKSSLADLYTVLAGARIVAGMEGSHLNHVHFCTPAGTAQVILVPHDHFNAVHLGLARAVGNYCGMYVLAGSKEDGYHMDFDEFAQTVDHTIAHFQKQSQHS